MKSPEDDRQTMTRDRSFVAIGALSALLGVAAGAFAAHGLRQTVPADLLVVFETGARYQMYHALALIAVGLALTRWPHRALIWAGWLFVAGTLLFSGSLYVLALSGARWWGAVTPFGGVAMLAGWASLAWGVLRSPIPD